jgi:hypothetical protein
MRRVFGIAVAAVALVGATASAQDASTAVKDGGIKVKDWAGKVDAREATAGLALKDQLFTSMGPGIHITTGPATTYWNTTQNLKGDYTVSATFSEAKQTMDHPHPFGVFVAGKNLESDKPEGLYCAAYRNGQFIFRGFSSTSTARGGVYQPTGNGRGQVNAAVQTAPDKDSPVKQSIAISVKGDKVSCTINGVEVQSYTKAEMIGDGKLSSLDGFAGIRMAHNTDAHISDWKVAK